MGNTSVYQRLGRHQGKPIDNDFPVSARTALVYVLADLKDKGYLESDNEVIRELQRIGRITKGDLPDTDDRSFINKVSSRLSILAWYQVYLFCERTYTKLLKEIETLDYYVGLAEVRQYFADEINLILEEENLAFHFVDGQFRRRGRAQTQKNLERVGAVLSDPRLEVVRNHYNKARRFFDGRPEPDSANCVKEAVCALEAAIAILTTKGATTDFEKAIRHVQGNAPNQIPAPIGEGIIKLHGYRGSGQGIAHAAPQGNKVTILEAELVLSLVASYITYLVDQFPFQDEIPF